MANRQIGTANLCAYHVSARVRIESMIDQGERLALAPQVPAEFVHVVTDPRRFSQPLTMVQAIARAEMWWHAQEVTPGFPSVEGSRLFLQWMRDHRLGRRRLLDTLLAATYYAGGIRSILSSNARGYAVFGCFDVVGPE